MIYHAVFPILDATPERVLRKQAMEQLIEMTKYVRIVGPWSWRKEARWLIAEAPAHGPEDQHLARRYAQTIHSILPDEALSLSIRMDEAA